MKALLTFVFVLTGMLSYAQDTIVTRAGQEILADVIEVTTTQLKYVRAGQPEGPMRIMEIKDIQLVKYEDGTIERFVLVDAQISARQTQPVRPPKVHGMDRFANKDRILEGGLFLELMNGWDQQVNTAGQTQNYYGFGARIGYKWYFDVNEPNYRLGFQATFLRFGVYATDIYRISQYTGGYISLSSLGVSNAFKLGERCGAELNANIGPTISSAVNGDIETWTFGVLGGAEAKFRVGRFAVGLDYAYIKESHGLRKSILSTTVGLKF